MLPSDPSLPIKKKAHNTPHEPTPKDRVLVQLAKTSGMTHDQIARQLEISRPTLEKHYREELDKGHDAIILKVFQNLVGIALNANDRKSALTASMFILKSKGGFNDKAAEMTKDETAIIEATGPVRVTLKMGTRLGEDE